jgi:hypothetical protein
LAGTNGLAAVLNLLTMNKLPQVATPAVFLCDDPGLNPKKQ